MKKIFITESQLSEIVKHLIVNEEYVEDPSFEENDIYDYKPTDDEINKFNIMDKGINSMKQKFQDKGGKSTGKAHLYKLIDGKKWVSILYGNTGLIMGKYKKINDKNKHNYKVYFEKE